MNNANISGSFSKIKRQSLPKIADGQEDLLKDVASAYWHDRDLRLLPFTNFMRLVLLHQIQTESTANAMAENLGIDHKTYAAWIQCLNSEAVLDELLDVVGIKLGQSTSVGLVRLQKTLLCLRAEICRESVPVTRRHAKLPTWDAFNGATTRAMSDVLFTYASRLELPRGTPVAIAARDIADGLSWAYGYMASRNVPAAWGKLQEAINSVCTAATEHALLSITANAVEGFAADQSVLARLYALESALDAKKEDALRFAGSYLQAVQQVVLDEDAWSEKAAALYPVLAPSPALATPDTQRLARLKALIDAAAEMTLCGFARDEPLCDFE